jgi:3-phenylpropionate/trans-cinnamate dioxygenase ferredoxin subunit
MTVDATVPPTPPIPLLAMDELIEGRGRRVCTAGYDLAVFKVGEAVYAIDDSCPHAGSSLSGGRVQGTTVGCPAHGLKFDLVHGRPRSPGRLRARTHGLRVVDGVVLLDPEASLPEPTPDPKPATAVRKYGDPLS